MAEDAVEEGRHPDASSNVWANAEHWAPCSYDTPLPTCKQLQTESSSLNKYL